MTRKYQTEQKTTTPNGYREYKKLQMRDVRKAKREELIKEAEAYAEVKAALKIEQYKNKVFMNLFMADLLEPISSLPFEMQDKIVNMAFAELRNRYGEDVHASQVSQVFKLVIENHKKIMEEKQNE